MSGIWKGSVVRGALVAISRSGAAVDAEIPASSAVPDVPDLTEADVVGLASTLSLRSYRVDSLASKICLTETRKAVYRGNALWLVGGRVCTFLVNDRTGKLTGP